MRRVSAPLFLMSWRALKRKARIRLGGRSGSGKKRTNRKEGGGHPSLWA